MKCRDGHESTESDYCSVCGAAMPAAAAAPGPPGAAAGGANACPSCGEPRSDLAARFCEVCRYDFVAKKAGPPPKAVAGPPLAPIPTPVVPKSVSKPVPQPGASAPMVGTPTGWELVLSVDASLDTDPDPATPCPAGTAEQVVAFTPPEMLVGRRDDRRDIRPELPLNDPGASRRHAKFVVNADGSVALQDLASTNGTKLNGVDVAPGSRQSLKNGDEVIIGRWTRIKVRAVV